MADLMEQKIAKAVRDVCAVSHQQAIPTEPSHFHQALAKAALATIREDHHVIPKVRPVNVEGE